MTAAGIIAFHGMERMQRWGGEGDVKRGLICSSGGYILSHVEMGHFSGYSPGSSIKKCDIFNG